MDMMITNWLQNNEDMRIILPQKFGFESRTHQSKPTMRQNQSLNTYIENISVARFFPWAFNRWFQALMFALDQNKLIQFHFMSRHDEVWTFEFKKKRVLFGQYLFLEVHVMAYPILKDWKQQSRFIYKNVGKFLFIKFDTKMMDIKKGHTIINWTHKKTGTINA